MKNAIYKFSNAIVEGIRDFRYIDLSEKLKKLESKKEVALADDYSDILINDLAKRLGTLDRLKYLKGTQIKDLIKANYKFINEETLYVAVAKILMRYSEDDFKYHKPEEERTDFIKILVDYYKKKRCIYEDKQCFAVYILLEYLIDFDLID